MDYNEVVEGARRLFNGLLAISLAANASGPDKSVINPGDHEGPKVRVRIEEYDSVNGDRVFLEGSSVGYDYQSRKFVVLDANNCVIDLLGDGVFDNGRVEILYHLRGGKIKDVPRYWIVKDAEENIILSGIVVVSDYSSGC